MTIFQRFLSLILAAAMLLPVSAFGQVGSGPPITEIAIEYSGPVTISKERIMANLKTKVGTPYSERAVEEDVRSLYATGEVSNVRIVAIPEVDGVKLTVVVVGRPVIGEILIEGAEAIDTNRVRRELGSEVGQSMSDERLADDRQKILKLYEDKYFADVQVAFRTEKIAGTEQVRVIFQINEGPKMKVKRISFVGGDSVKPGDIRKVMKTKTANILSFITKAGRILPAQMDEDRAAIRTLFQNRGFADVQVGEFQTVPIDDEGVELVVTIDEGQQYRVNNVTVEGTQIEAPDKILQNFKMVGGSLYTPEGMAADLKALRDLYGKQGYIDMVAFPEVFPTAPGAVDVIYRVDEGVQSYVNLVNIQGNTRTKDRVIRRELAIRPGDVFDTTMIDLSRNRLDNLNYFSKVDMAPQSTIVPGRKDLNVIVQEKRTGSFNFGVGFSTIDSLVGFAELQQSNFDLLGWPTFVGGGQRFRTRVQYGLERRDFVIALTEPWFFGYQFSVGVEGFYREANFLSTVYDQSNLGFAIQTRKAITSFLSVRGEYRLENVRIFDVDTDSVGPTILDNEGTRSRSALQGTVSWDTRDSLFLTRKGELIELTGFVAGGFLGADIQDYGITLAGSKFFPLPFDFILNIRGQLAVVDGWGGQSGPQNVPIFDRLYLGGANDLRGFDFRDVGPKDSFGNPIGGSSLGYLTTEVTFPVIPRVRGALFFDAGYVNADAYDFNGENFNADIGIGVRVELPIGPIRIDYGFPIRTDQFNNSSGKVNFNIGYQF